MNSPTSIAIALGSNIGDRESHLAFAAGRLAALFDDLRLSSAYETDPVGVLGTQGRFLNAAATAWTALSARSTLERLLAIERERGRQRPYPGAARTLDLDLILFGDVVMHEVGLTIPHPRFRERLFVLDPLAEIASGWSDPVSGLTVGQLLANLRSESPAPRG